MNSPGAYQKATIDALDRLVTMRYTPGCDSARTSTDVSLKMSNFAFFWLIFYFPRTRQMASSESSSKPGIRHKLLLASFHPAQLPRRSWA